MLDINFIRNNPEKVKQGCQKKQVDVDIDRLLDLDKQKRELIQQTESLRAEQKKLSRDEIDRARELKIKFKSLSDGLSEREKELNDLMIQIPNLPSADVPEGKDETENLMIKEVGKLPRFNFKVRDHLELGESLDLIDVKRAAKVSGPRFGYLKKEAALLELALINFAFDKLIKKGFSAVVPPTMIKPEMALGMGYLEQTDDNEAYFLPKDNLYLIGTAEQSIGTMHSGEILAEKDLPKRYLGFSSCFRREAGSYGKDTRGIFRVHQFDKIEMFSFSKPEDSEKEHKFLLSLEEELMNDLKIPYRVVQICSGDLAKPAAATYDIETWLPGQKKYREIGSTSNCTDFQARRLNIRYQDSKTQKLEFVHTLNATALAIGRTIIAILENYQRKDGKIDVPKVLQKYLGFKKIPRR